MADHPNVLILPGTVVTGVATWEPTPLLNRLVLSPESSEHNGHDEPPVTGSRFTCPETVVPENSDQ